MAAMVSLSEANWIGPPPLNVDVWDNEDDMWYDIESEGEAVSVVRVNDEDEVRIMPEEFLVVYLGSNIDHDIYAAEEEGKSGVELVGIMHA